MATKVVLRMPKEPMFVGSYARIPVNIDPVSGLSFENLRFTIREGDRGGQVSQSRDATFESGNPHIMLLTGYQPGIYTLQAIEKATNTAVGRSRFEISTLWPNDDLGPPVWVCGDYKLPGLAGAAWGGGSPTEPDNYQVSPAIGQHSIAVLLIDTSTQRFAANEEQPTRDLWNDVAFNGRVVNGKTISASHYYREVSYNLFNFTGQVFGPVHLSGTWTDYIQDSGEPKGNFWQACATAGDNLIDYSQFQYLVCVLRSIDATPTTSVKRVWPWANSIAAKTAEGDIPLGMVAIHADGQPFDLCAILVHELGHDIELGGDVYAWSGHTPQIRAREMGGWDIMANHGGLPHPALAHRLRKSWIPKEHLKLFNFQARPGPVDETVTLHPIESGNPPAGRYSGIEVRIGPGWDYYFEYRVAQGVQIGDQHLPTTDRILGTDVMYTENLETISRRKPMMLLENDADGDGPVLNAGQDYKAQDITNYPQATDFRALVVNNDGSKADVRIQYGLFLVPDPSIRPWDLETYQSPDIEVRNERSLADPKWFNVPWEDHINTLIARVTNMGSWDAPGVWVDFWIHDYTLNNPFDPPIHLDAVQKNVAAGKTEEFTTLWRPGKAGHYCIEARIRHYQTPGPNSVIEATEYNNRAQSNYDRFISKTSSPPSRQIASVSVQNPFDQPVRARIRVVKSTSPLFRTYLQNAWLILEPKEKRDVQVMFEYAYEEDPIWIPELEAYIKKPNQVSINAIVHEHEREPREMPILLGGLAAQVVKARSTQIDHLVYDPPSSISGRVIAEDSGEPIPGGQIIFVMQSGDDEWYRTEPVHPNGIFYGHASGDWQRLHVYYVPLEGFADCISHTIGHN